MERKDHIPMPTLTLEDRVAKLDKELAAIKQELAIKNGQANEPAWKQIIGVFKDCPEFEESVRLGREWRESQ